MKVAMEKKNLEAWTEHTVCAHNGSVLVCVCLVSEFELGSSWSSYASLGVCKRSIASSRMCISICVSKCMCVYCFVRVPLCTRVLFVREWADAGSLAGHICDHRLLLTLKL